MNGDIRSLAQAYHGSHKSKEAGSKVLASSAEEGRYGIGRKTL